MKASIGLALVGAAVLSVAAHPPLLADELEFNFQDPKGVNSVQFLVDSPLEPILGVAAGVSGKIKFDPRKPEKTVGSILVEAKSVHVPNGRMKTKLHTEQWLDSEGHPTIEFRVKKVKKVKKVKGKKGVIEVSAVGDFTCKGITKELTVPVQISYLKGRLPDRGPRNMKGDLLVVRSTFVIKRTDFSISPEMNKEVVADEIEVRLAVVGYHKKA